MATVIARSSGPQRPPRKKHSFMSLHRDKSLDSRTEKSIPPPPSHQLGYFDLYPTRSDSKAKRGDARLQDRELEREGEVYAFPSVSDAADNVQLTPQASRTRQRSRTNPPPESHLPPLRFSGSSAFSHSPPSTPTSSFPEFAVPRQRIEVLMSAPVVETSTMDAFVDGMNGGEEDVFSSMDILRQGRRRKKSSTSSKNFHHPLYHPPLPTPPPGVKLGGAVPRAAGDSDADDDDSEDGTKSPPRSSRSRPGSSHTRPGSARSRFPSSRHGSTSTITNNPAKTPRRAETPKQLPSPPASVSPPPRTSQTTSPVPSPSSSTEIMTTNASIDEIVRRFVQVTDAPPKPVVPSISDIIRTHAPEHATKRHRPQLSVTMPATLPSPVVEDTDQQSPEDPTDHVSRSSIDSIAEEVQKTLRVSRKHPATALHHARSFQYAPAQNTFSSSQGSNSTRSPRSDGGHRSPSLSSFSTSVNTAPPLSPPISLANLGADGKANPNLALANFLRSPRLTKLLKLKRSPNSRLQVSFSDLGSSTGKPVVVFLGLGCVRYIMGLYDEMAEALGLRLITIDRWGLGRTDNPPRTSPRGVMEWASVVEEVLDHLNIDRCNIMAHSAGAPYAMAFANRSPERIQGDLCLLAPWVGAGEGASGYKWLKYVPTGLIKTAQAAEWKVQAWMLGKPPAVTYTGIGYNVHAPVASSTTTSAGRPSFTTSLGSRESREYARPSMSSFSDYDDLADFKGHYASRSTIHVNGDNISVNSPPPVPPLPDLAQSDARKRAGSKSSRFFGGLWKSGDSSSFSSPSANKSPPRLKALKSMSSLRGGASSKSSPNGSQKKKMSSRPSTANIEDWNLTTNSAPSSARPQYSRTSFASSTMPEAARGHGRNRRSISLSSATAPSFSHPPSIRSKRHHPSSPPMTASTICEASPGPSSAAIGNALLAASHAESSKGTHADLLQILNHSQKPWGFSYSEFPRPVKVWYGDKDEKIAEGAVRWMEKTMRPGSCDVCIVKGAGHALMYNGNVVVEVLEFLKETWED